MRNQELQNSFLYGQYFRRIAFHVMHQQDELLAPYDITSQQARALGGIHRLNKQQGYCCQKDLEVSFGLRGSSVTSLIKGLERRGYISRVSGQDDARTKLLSLTEKGEQLMGTFHKILCRAETRILQGMSDEEKKVLLNLLERASANLDN